MPAFDAHSNLAYSLVATAPSPATSGTSLVVTAGQGVRFPAAPFNVVIWPTVVQPLTTNAEVVRVTVVATDTFTITRTQEGTSARTVVIGDQIALMVSARTITDIEASARSRVSSLDFTTGELVRRFTISDTSVLSTSVINSTIMRPNVTELTDEGFLYSHSISSVGAGTFDVLVVCLDGVFGMDDARIPNETLTLAYKVF